MIKHRLTQIHTDKRILSIVKRALREDIGSGDITTDSLIRKDIKVKAIILAKENGILAGLEIAKLCFKILDRNIVFIPKKREGEEIKKGQIIAEIEGKADKILNAERTALNFLMHLSGIATLTKRFVERVKPYNIKITDTRKTIPGLRILEKYAVRMGGGQNHRMGLWDRILIKGNHIKVQSSKFIVHSLKEIIEETKRKIPKDMKIEIEVKNMKEFKDALKAEPDIIMLDNMSIKDIRKAVMIKNQKPPPKADLPIAEETRNQKLEVSGNINLTNVRKIAQTGVDMISIGSLTHSAKAIDMSLKVLG